MVVLKSFSFLFLKDIIPFRNEKEKFEWKSLEHYTIDRKLIDNFLDEDRL